MNDSMKLCILDLLSCELALFSSFLIFWSFYNFHTHFLDVLVYRIDIPEL